MAARLVDLASPSVAPQKYLKSCGTGLSDTIIGKDGEHRKPGTREHLGEDQSMGGNGGRRQLMERERSSAVYCRLSSFRPRIADGSSMSLTKCQYCDHGNPAESKFCNACGATLTLAPCPHCGAVNQIKAMSCYQCRGALPGGRTDELAAAVPAAAVPAAVISESVPRRPARAIVGIAVLAAVGVLGYYAYRQQTPVGVPAPPTAGSEAKARGSPVDAGAIDKAPANAVALDVATGTSPSEIPPAGTVRAPAKPVAAAAPAAARPRATDTGKGPEQGPPRLGPCTEALAALGLCTLKPNQRRE